MPYYIKHRPSKKKEKPLPLFDKVGIKIKKKPDLVARLDKVFSRYIRLRDCMPNRQIVDTSIHAATWPHALTRIMPMQNVGRVTASAQII